ncbi:branched-chain amino acid aminotransferase [Hyphobacterium sp. CCMP332]|nr:branched-chain amino acid aminotransferase [Hyphobacterium sp. CCMP332]
MINTFEIQIQKTEKTKISSVDFDNVPFGKVYSDHMFLAEYKEGQWGNFRIEPYRNISLSPANSALHYGQSIFEGMKAYKMSDGKISIFRPHKNFQRMNRSAERMCMPAISEELFFEGIRSLVDLDREWIPSKENTSLYIRPFMFAIDEYIGIKPSDNYLFMIFTCPVGAYYAKPVNVKIETKYTRAVEGGTGAAKAAGNYAASLFPARIAQKEGYQQLIWTDGKEHKFIEESGTMNLMFVASDTLYTAPTGDTILEGVTRDSVLTLARDWGMKVEERRIQVSELVDALKEGRVQEAFGTGTAATIAHIASIGYEDKRYELPALENRTFSNKVLATLEGIKRGTQEDKFNWNYIL